MFEKLPYSRDSSRLSGVFFTGESIMNTNNYKNIFFLIKHFLDVPIGTRKSCLRKKTGDEQSSDTVPLMSLYLPYGNPHLSPQVYKKNAVG
jgi:hypothetical protein